jgi:hypothetical protein
VGIKNQASRSLRVGWEASFNFPRQAKFLRNLTRACSGRGRAAPLKAGVSLYENFHDDWDRSHLLNFATLYFFSF